MTTLDDIITETLTYVENKLQDVYELGLEGKIGQSLEADTPDITDPPINPVVPLFPADSYAMIKWPGDTYCCKLQRTGTWKEIYEPYDNNYIYASALYVIRDVIAPVVYKKYNGLVTMLYELSKGRLLTEGENNGHPGQSHSKGAVDKQYYGWPTKLLVKPELDFTQMCYECFSGGTSERYEARVSAQVKSALEFENHRKLPYVKVEPAGHGFTEDIMSHSHHRVDLGGMRIDKSRVDALVQYLISGN